MKYSTLLLLILSTPAIAQDFPFPTSGAVWVNTGYYMATPPPFPTWTLGSYTNLCANGVDTVINTDTYTKLQHCSGGYKGAFRVDGGRVHYVPGDSLQEFLLYDFSLNAGDTAFNVYFEPALDEVGMVMDLVITDATINDQLGGRKVLQTSEGGEWIEGIGAAWGLLSEPWINVSNYMLQLECMSLGDSIRFPQADIGPGICALITGMTTVEDVPTVRIHPNPTTDGRVQLTMAVAADRINVTVHAVDGRRVAVNMIRLADGILLDLGPLRAGVYLVQVPFPDGMVTQRVLRL